MTQRLWPALLLLLGGTGIATATPILGILDLMGSDPLSVPPVAFSNQPVGGSFTVVFQAYESNIFFGGPINLYAFNFDLTYDPSVIHATQIQELGYFAQNGLGLYYNLTQGQITNIGDVVAGPGPGENLQYSTQAFGADSLLAITFVAVGSGQTTITIPQNGDLYYSDSNGNLTTPIVGSDQVNVYQLVGTGAPSSTPEPGSAGMLACGGLVLLGFGATRRQRAKPRQSLGGGNLH